MVESENELLVSATQRDRQAQRKRMSAGGRLCDLGSLSHADDKARYCRCFDQVDRNTGTQWTASQPYSVDTCMMTEVEGLLGCSVGNDNVAADGTTYKYAGANAGCGSKGCSVDRQRSAWKFRAKQQQCNHASGRQGSVTTASL